jgi:cation diffusion facilitator family transporter
MGVSLAASIVMLVGKLTAYYLTSSAAIFSDACESLVHGVATALAAFSLWYADQPADERYLYGHGKIVYFSAGFEGALILAAAVAVVYTSIGVWLTGGGIRRLGWGVAITSGLGLFNLGLGLMLVAVGKRHNSLVLVANGKHVLSDMWTSLGAVGGLGLVWLTELRWIDPVTGLLIGLQILYTAVSLVKRAYFGLMDRADPSITAKLVQALEHAVHEYGLVGYHQLRHRHSNDQTWVEVHLLVPGTTTTEVAHRKASQTEERIREALAGNAVWVTSHIEPSEHDRAHPEGHVIDPIRETGEYPTTDPSDAVPKS